MNDDFDTVDLFAGAGGLDLAARGAGRRVVGIEQWGAACETRDAAGLATVRADVRTLGPADFPAARHLMGGPPCQTFSVTGNGAGRRALETVRSAAWLLHSRMSAGGRIAELDDERTGLVLEPLRWALQALDAGRPYETVMLEQVPTVLPVWETFARILELNGYSAACGVLKAEQFGVPQTRRRAFLVARRWPLDARLPQPTHLAYRERAGLLRLPACRSMRDVLPHRDPFTVVSNYGTGGDPKNRGRRHWSEPSATVTGNVTRMRLVGPDGRDLEKPHDRFTHAEAGVLQTFPADHKWSGRDVGQQIGNACPPLLAGHVLSALTPLTRASHEGSAA